MAKTKKPVYEWFRHGWDYYAPIVCENGDPVLSIYTYRDRPLISCSLRVAYFNAPSEEIWQNGHRISIGGPGWRYALCAYAGSGWNMICITGRDGPILAASTVYATRFDAIRAALYQFVEACDKLLLIPSDSSRPYWGPSQGRYFSRPGAEQLAFYLCMPEWEPMWLLLEEVTRHDDWLAEVRAPKKAAFTEQLQLF